MQLVGLVLALAAALTPPVAHAQQAVKVCRIGFLGLSSATDYAPYLESFRRGLRLTIPQSLLVRADEIIQ
jgi:hypothetical protein